jgi:hypothetical protein
VSDGGLTAQGASLNGLWKIMHTPIYLYNRLTIGIHASPPGVAGKKYWRGFGNMQKAALPLRQFFNTLLIKKG